MAKAMLRGRDCGDLLSFEDVRRRLNLGTRLPVGRREVRVADIIGSVGRVHDFDGCFRPKTKGLRTAIRERAADPSVIDKPITLIQVDHGYFVEDGHKRLSLVIAAGRTEVDADVDRFETELHVGPGATMASIRASARELRFRKVTGLAAAYPRKRFALSDPDGYLELEESVKAHTLDLSHDEGRLLSPEEGARHWYETVFKPVLDIVEKAGSFGSSSRRPTPTASCSSGVASPGRWRGVGGSHRRPSNGAWRTSHPRTVRVGPGCSRRSRDDRPAGGRPFRSRRTRSTTRSRDSGAKAPRWYPRETPGTITGHVRTGGHVRTPDRGESSGPWPPNDAPFAGRLELGPSAFA